MTETAPKHREGEDDQILSLVETLRADVMPVLAPKLAYHVDLACKLITMYRLKDRRAAALSRMMNGEVVQR